jgi:predicted DNA-binding protein (MmcQ/YjbR family)
MTIDSVRKFCMALPHTTEKVQWGNDLVFKIGGKIYAVVVLEPAAVWMSFKTTPEQFAELTERPGIIPAPYSARYFWVAIESEDTMPAAELKDRLRESYRLVKEKLPKKVLAGLGGAPVKPARKKQ